MIQFSTNSGKLQFGFTNAAFELDFCAGFRLTQMQFELQHCLRLIVDQAQVLCLFEGQQLLPGKYFIPGANVRGRQLRRHRNGQRGDICRKHTPHRG